MRIHLPRDDNVLRLSALFCLLPFYFRFSCNRKWKVSLFDTLCQELMFEHSKATPTWKSCALKSEIAPVVQSDDPQKQPLLSEFSNGGRFPTK